MQGNGQLPVSDSRCVLLTGGTGGLGRVLLSTLLRLSDCKILVLARSKNGYIVNQLSFDTTNTERALKGTPVVMPDTGRSFLLRILLYTVRAGYLVLDQAPEAGQRPEL